MEEFSFHYSQQLTLSETRTVYSVSEINRRARALLEESFSMVWVEGEISNFKKHTSGHIYFAIKDAQAQISAVFFSRQNQFLKFDLKDGLQVLLLGRVSLYDARGQYQFYVERIEPKGVGALQIAFAQLREKLEKEGLFDISRKKKIPEFPESVGIVTSATGAALRDVLNVLERRFCGKRIVLYPVKVQGEGSALEIANAIAAFNEWKEIDVMIVGRGGGSIEDLWAFNEEIVVRAIASSVIPVISAVGHETDWTLSDAVADLRAPTPSAAAELVTQNRQDFVEGLQLLETRLARVMRRQIADFDEQLSNIESSYAFQNPLHFVEAYWQRLDDWSRLLINSIERKVKESQEQIENLGGQLHALSPLGVLNRGFSLTLDENGKIVKNAHSLKEGQILKTIFQEGEIHSRVEDIRKGGHL